MEFVKMQGLGNDFIFIDRMNGKFTDDPGALAKRLCARGISVGADGLVLLLPSEIADVRMRMFNPDGSEAEMCGNAARCVAKYLFDRGRLSGSSLSVDTPAGIRRMIIQIQNGKMQSASVDMGAPQSLGEVRLPVNGTNAVFHKVSTGNPHAVTWSVWPDDETFFRCGPRIERNPCFPEGANVEFCRILSRDHIEVRVWERGAGATLACGTGATAAFFACRQANLVDASATVTLPGGDLQFELPDDGHVRMTGPAEEIYRAEINNL